MDEKLSLTTPEYELSQKLVTAQTSNEVQDIIDLFNLNIQKSEILRASRLSGVLDTVTTQIEDRLSSKPDLFTNRELLEYLGAIEKITMHATDSINKNNLPQIQVNQQNINIGSDAGSISRESRERIMDVLQAIMNTDTTDYDNYQDIIDVEEDNVTECEYEAE